MESDLLQLTPPRENDENFSDEEAQQQDANSVNSQAELSRTLEGNYDQIMQLILKENKQLDEERQLAADQLDDGSSSVSQAHVSH